MKYAVRFVLYWYDVFDTTNTNIYDVIVKAPNPDFALALAVTIFKETKEIYNYPNRYNKVRFISVTDEKGEIYVSKLSPQNHYYGEDLPLENQWFKLPELIKVPKEDHGKLPKKFCFDGETFFVIYAHEMIPKLR